MDKHTVTIHGKIYDAHSGLAVGDTTHHRAARQSHALHSKPQRSRTLNRNTVHRDPAPSAAQPSRHSTTATTRSPHISKFAHHESTVASSPSIHMKIVSDMAPKTHPIVARTHQRMATRATTVHPAVHAHKPPAVLKQEAIDKALKEAKPHKHEQIRRPRLATRPIGIMSAALAFAFIAAYFTYINMPNLSVRVAAASAGIDASYPSYHPDGYRLAGPVAYSDGEVLLSYASTTNPTGYKITQTRTAWDSSAVRENYIRPHWGDTYSTHSQNGLTIYSHDGEAVWVNGGIRYTISGNAPLSDSQLRSIASGM